MDNAVALVRAYLQLNGYFTITEYPVVRRLENGGFRTLTEIDVAAFHLPEGEADFEPDPALNVPRDKADLIIGEVKERRAVINEAATDSDVVAKILRRFGFGDSTAADARSSARTLLEKRCDRHASRPSRAVGGLRDGAQRRSGDVSHGVAVRRRRLCRSIHFGELGARALRRFKRSDFGVMVFLAKARAAHRG